MKVTPEFIDQLKTMAQTMSYSAIERATGIGRRSAKRLVEKEPKKTYPKRLKNMEPRMKVSYLKRAEEKITPEGCFNVWDINADWLTG